MIERRTKAGYKLRVYIEAIGDTDSMTDQEWSYLWALANNEGPYLTRLMWIEYLKDCALKEVKMYIVSEAA